VAHTHIHMYVPRISTYFANAAFYPALMSWLLQLRIDCEAWASQPVYYINMEYLLLYT
jgi:hypothetical protein